MGAFSFPTFSSDPSSIFLGDGSIFVGGSQNSNNDPLAGLGGAIPGGIFLPSGAPTPSASSAGGSSDAQSWLKTLFPWANLGTQAFLADQAINSPRPATITYLPNGQIAVSGGGAATPSTGLGLALGAIPSWIWIAVVVVVLISVLKK